MLKQIMKRAHEMARNFEGDYQARLALALRIAWKEQKEEKEMTKEELIAKVKKAIVEENKRPNNRFDHTYSVTRWQKYGKDRLYINRNNGNREKGQGYFDLAKMKSQLDMAPGHQLYRELTNIEEQL
jgi:hypothetical protein